VTSAQWFNLEEFTSEPVLFETTRVSPKAVEQSSTIANYTIISESGVVRVLNLDNALVYIYSNNLHKK